MKKSKMPTMGIMAGAMLTAAIGTAMVRSMSPKRRAKKKMSRALKSASNIIDSIAHM